VLARYAYDNIASARIKCGFHSMLMRFSSSAGISLMQKPSALAPNGERQCEAGSKTAAIRGHMLDLGLRHAHSPLGLPLGSTSDLIDEGVRNA